MKIKTKGTPCLHMESRPLTQVNKNVLKFAAKMLNVMAKENGVGIAAPQVGKNIQLCAMVDHENQQIVVMINPRIIKWSTETSIQEEGCLSCPGETVFVERANEVEVDYVGIDGEPKKAICKGIDARIIQHELDHLEGVLIVDHEDKRPGNSD